MNASNSAAASGGAISQSAPPPTLVQGSDLKIYASQPITGHSPASMSEWADLPAVAFMPSRSSQETKNVQKHDDHGPTRHRLRPDARAADCLRRRRRARPKHYVLDRRPDDHKRRPARATSLQDRSADPQ